jgi:hypothetical protein
MAEQLFCKQLVGGSIPFAGSILGTSNSANFRRVLKRLVPLCLAVLLASCAVRYVAPSPPPPTLPPLPSIAPTGPQFRGEQAGNVDCPKAIGSTGGYGLFGARAEDFNAAHQGSQILARCSTDGKVIVLQLDLAPPGSASAALAAATKQLPADLKLVYDKTQANCRDLQYRSDILASQLGVDDPEGVVNVELESALAANFKYDHNRVDTAVIHQLYAVNQSSACLRG